MRKIFFTLMLAASCAAQAGDGTVARLVNLKGNVLVSSDWNIATAGESLRLVPGARVLVTTNSKAVVEYHDGCRVELHAGERFEIRAEAPCSTRAGSANVKAATR